MSHVIGGAMNDHHYHLVLTGDGGPCRSETFATWEEAEENAAALSRESAEWVPRRYPGRAWHTGEIAVYLDRRTLLRRVPDREIVIIRCDGQDIECWAAEASLFASSD